MTSRRRLVLRMGLAMLVLGSLAANAGFVGAAYYGLSPSRYADKMLRIVAQRPLAWLYSEDAEDAVDIANTYWHGDALVESSRLSEGMSLESGGGSIRVSNADTAPLPATTVPFVYQSPDAPYLVELRETFELDNVIANADSEYDAMIRLARWVGTAFDHGEDPLPTAQGKHDPLAILKTGQAGAAYWCEVAAHTMTQAATSLGFVARLVTISHDGYDWSHAVTELWSNEFRKWVLIDTDFNVIYKDGGVPLSAAELVDLNRDHEQGRVTFNHFAPSKPFFTKRNGMFRLAPARIRYAHVDMRTDWRTRPLRRGSPAGGDLATWRYDYGRLDPLLSAIPRIESAQRFNWPMNGVDTWVSSLKQDNGQLQLVFSSRTYSPNFVHFEWRVDGGDWNKSPDGKVTISLSEGVHRFEVRVRLANQRQGPESNYTFSLKGAG